MACSMYSNSSTGHVSTGNTSILSGAGTATISFWANFTDTSTTQVILSRYSSALDRWGVYISGDKVYILIWAGSFGQGAMANTLTTEGVSTNEWNHFSLGWNGSTGWNFYINGESVSTSGAAPGGTIASGGAAYTLFERTDGSSPSDMYMCHVAVYSQLLSQAEVKEIKSKPNAYMANVESYIPLMGDSSDIDHYAGDTATYTSMTVSRDGPPVQFY